MLASCADGTYSRYCGYWRQFGQYCAERNIDPCLADIGSILAFVDDCRSRRRWTYSSVKVCVAALSRFRGKIDGSTVFTHDDMAQYLAGAKKLSIREGLGTAPDTWDAPLVLQALGKPPFEPMARVGMRFVSAKLAVLLALTTASRGCELTALTVRGHVFSGDFKVTLFRDPSFVPKTVSDLSSRTPVVVQAFHPSPVSQEERRLHLLCPVRALRIYLQRTQAVRKSDRLLVTYWARNPGTALSTQRLAHWLVDGITVAYTEAGKVVPKLTAHSTRGTATSIAVLAGIDWEVIRKTAAWRGESTFLKHYYRHMEVRSVADAVLEQAL